MQSVRSAKIFGDKEDPKAELAAIAALRREKPELTLRTAAYLVKRAIRSAA
jgi:hypothetical protein